MMPLMSSGASCIVLCTVPPLLALGRCYKLSGICPAWLPGEAVGSNGRREDARRVHEDRVDRGGGASAFGNRPHDQALTAHGIAAGEDWPRPLELRESPIPVN